MMSLQHAPADPALETLLGPLQQGELSWPSASGLFLNARDGSPLHGRSLPGMVCVQGFKPYVDALRRSGFEVEPEPPTGRRFPLVLVLPARQRELARALYAHASDLLAPGGVILACQANSEGAKSSEADLARLAGPLQVRSKNKCRVFWTQPDATVDTPLRDAWRALDTPREIEPDGFISRPGVFAWDRIDAASRMLAEHLPSDLTGAAADFGAGWGFLSMQLLERCPGVTTLDLFEADARALDLARINLARRQPGRTVAHHWEDVTCGVSGCYDVVVCNPPFHTQQAGDRPDIGRAFIDAAADVLKPGGRLWLVANRHLPYEATLDALFHPERIVAQQHGFKIIEATKRIESGRAAR